MMSVLDKITKLEPKAPRLTIYGKPGVGKSTLASQFPEPLFLLTEETGLVNVTAIPVAVTFLEMWNNVKELLAVEDLPYKTIVIDSISKLDALIVKHILDEEPPSKSGKAATLNSACGGYGSGVLRCQSIHRAFKAMMDKFQDKGIGVVYVSHSAVSKIKSPDAEDYDINSIVMNHDKSREIYLDDVDGVLFCRLRSHVMETDSGRAIVKSTGERIIMAGVNEAHVSKNRYNMPNEFPMKIEEIMKYIPYYQLKEEKE